MALLGEIFICSIIYFYICSFGDGSQGALSIRPLPTISGIFGRVESAPGHFCKDTEGNLKLSRCKFYFTFRVERHAAKYYRLVLPICSFFFRFFFFVVFCSPPRSFFGLNHVRKVRKRGFNSRQ